tara:strand:+ start:1429 stop:1626 length:198 start_codon:yes stop_codon:yes gene_type:complete
MKNRCPDCNEKVGEKSFLKKYEKNLYLCSSCNRAWDESTKYCKICYDVVMYCRCYEDVIDDIMGK